MKSTKLILGTMVLGLGMTAAAWAQPAPNHDRDAGVRGGYAVDRDDAYRGRGYQDEWRGDRDDVFRYRYNPYVYQRGDGDHDRDDRNVWSRGDRDDRNAWRGDRDARRSWNWGHSRLGRGKADNR
jgi:hypothetical protein